MFPTGKAIKSGELSEGTTPAEIVKQMQSAKLTGYIAFTFKTKNGFEDYVAAFINGQMQSAFCENFKTKTKLSGEQAFKAIENCSNEAIGFFDIVSLSEEQVKLAIAVRPEIKVAPAADQTKEEILKRYGLATLVENYG